MAEKLWYKTHLRRMLFEFHQQDKWPFALRELDIKNIARQIARANVEFLYVHSQDNQGISYFNTKIGHKHQGLGDKDCLAEIIEELAKYQIEVGVYFQLTRDNRMYKLHPEWRQLWQDGTPRGLLEQQNPDWDNMCPNSPFREYSLALLKEITENYDIKAFWLDRLDWGGVLPDKFSCACDYCKRKFASETGYEIPNKVDWKDPAWKEFIIWRSKVLYNYLQEIRDTVKGIKPDVAIGLNYYGVNDLFGGWFHGQDPEDITDPADFLCPELHYEREGNLGYSCMPRFMRGASGGKSFVNETPRQSGDIDWAMKPLEQLKAETFTTLANGGAMAIADLVLPSGGIQSKIYDYVEEIYSEVKEREEWIIDGNPVPFGALYYSKNSRLFHGREKLDERYLYGFLGAYKAVLESHMPFEIVTDRHMDPEKLKKYKVLIVPNAVCMSESQSDALREYVRNGGGIVATGATSLKDEWGKPRGDFSLADLFSVHYIEQLTLPVSYVQVTSRSLGDNGVPMDIPLFHRDWQFKVRPGKNADILGWIVYSIEGFNRITAGCDPPMAEHSGFPAVVSSTFGRGRVVYFAGRPASVYARWGHPEFRNLLINAVKWAANEKPPLEVEGPKCIEATMFEQQNHNRIVVHLVNFQSEIGRTLNIAKKRFLG